MGTPRDLVPVGDPSTTTTYQAVWNGPLLEPSPFGTAPTGQMKPGTKIVTATLLNPDPRFVITNPTSKTVGISAENALIAYVSGSPISLGGQSTTQLKVIVSEPADGSPGELRNAQVQFIDRGTSTLLGTVNVAADGTAILPNWAPNLAGANSKDFTIGFVVIGYYTRNSTLDNVTVTVTK